MVIVPIGTERMGNKMEQVHAVITGGPSVGKTTCLGLAQQRGCNVVPELATQVIMEGKVLPWVDHIGFQWEVLRRQIAAERRVVNSASPVIMDRGVYDAIAYRMVHGWQVQDFLKRLQPKRYDVAFIFPPLTNTWQDNGVRYEDPHFARELTPFLKRVYEDAGIPTVQVPEGTPEERLEFILRTLKWTPRGCAGSAVAIDCPALYLPSQGSQPTADEVAMELAVV